MMGTQNLYLINRMALAILVSGLGLMVLISLFTVGDTTLAPVKLRLPANQPPVFPIYPREYPQANVFDEARADWQASRVPEAFVPRASDMKGFLKAGDLEAVFTDGEFILKGGQTGHGTFEGVKGREILLNTNGTAKRYDPGAERDEAVRKLPITIKPVEPGAKE